MSITEESLKQELTKMVNEVSKRLEKYCNP